MKPMKPVLAGLALLLVVWRGHAEYRTVLVQVTPPAPAPEQRDPEQMFRKACERFVALEAKYDLLKGVSEVKPVIARDDEGRLKTADFVFARNAVPFGKGSARAKDESKPFAYVAVQVWSGRTPSPPANLHEFEWRGQTYQMWVRVIGSDAKLVQTILQSVDEPLREPPVLSLSLQASQSLRAFRQGQPLVFEGIAVVPIHRPGPEHFKITHVTDTQVVPFRVAYDRERVERELGDGRQKQARKQVLEEVYVYNSLFKGTHLFLYNGSFNHKETERQAGILELYGCPELEAGVRYRLTWACWPVGESKAIEVSCEFELGK